MTLREELEECLNVTVQDPEFLRGMANTSKDRQVSLLAVGMRMRYNMNPDGLDLILAAAAYGLLRRYEDLQGAPAPAPTEPQPSTYNGEVRTVAA